MYFVSFYRGREHVVFYKRCSDRHEAKRFVKETYGKVSDLVIDKVEA